MILELKIRRLKDYSVLQILRQSFPITFNGTKYRLDCVSVPDISYDTFYLQGTHSNANLNWIEFSKDYYKKVLDTLKEYSLANHLMMLSYLISNDELIIKLEPFEQFVNPAFINDTDAIIKLIDKLTITKYENLPIISICSVCKKESNTNKKVKTQYGNKDVCEKCMSEFKTCNSCSYLDLKTEFKSIYNSLNQCKELCKNCSRTFTCNCGFNEPSIYKKKNIYITNKGNNKINNSCLKCSHVKKHCEYCQCYYDNKEYNKCPCQIPVDFNKIVRRWDSDVTQILEYSKFAEMGIEIEAGIHVTNRHKFEEIYKHTMDIIKQDAILVFDRSIDEVDVEQHIKNDYRGFEIVSKPLSRRDMLKYINNLCDKRHKNLLSWDVKTAGIHIHMAKKNPTNDKVPFLTRIDIGKLLVFVNNPKNQELIKFVGRRYNQRYARFSNKTILDYKNNHPDCHYEILNTNKPHTIEFRMFRGSMKKEIILSYIQFVWSLIDFIKHTPKEFLLTEYYLNWLGSSCNSKFRELKARMNDFGKKDMMEIGGDN